MEFVLLGSIGLTEIIVLLLALVIIVLVVIAIVAGIRRVFKPQSIESKLKRAKKMLDDKLLTEEEYETMKAQIIKESKI